MFLDQGVLSSLGLVKVRLEVESALGKFESPVVQRLFSDVDFLSRPCSKVYEPRPSSAILGTTRGVGVSNIPDAAALSREF